MKNTIWVILLLFLSLKVFSQREPVTVGMTGAQVRSSINNAINHMTISYPNTYNLQTIIDESTADTVYLRLAEGEYDQDIVTTKYLIIIGEPRETLFHGYISTGAGIYIQGVDFNDESVSNVINFDYTVPSIDGVYIDDCQFLNTSSGTGGSSIHYYGGTTSTFIKDVTIKNCVFKDGGTAIMMSPVVINATITNCIFKDLYRPSTDVRCIYLGANDNQETLSGNYFINQCQFLRIGTGQTDIHGSTSAVLLYGHGVSINNCLLDSIYGVSSEGIYTKASNVIVNNCIFRNVLNESIELKPHGTNIPGNYVISNISSTREGVVSLENSYDIYIDGYATISNVSIKQRDVAYNRGIRILNSDSTNTYQGQFILNNIFCDVVALEAITANVGIVTISLNNVIAQRITGTDAQPLINLLATNIFVNRLNTKTKNGGQALFALGSVVKVTNSEFTDSLVSSGYPTIDLSSDSLIIFENNIVNTSAHYQFFELKGYEAAPYPAYAYIRGNKFFIHPTDENDNGLMQLRATNLDFSTNTFEISAYYRFSLGYFFGEYIDRLTLNGNIINNRVPATSYPGFRFYGDFDYVAVEDNYCNTGVSSLIEFSDGCSADFIKLQNNTFYGNKLFSANTGYFPYTATPGQLIMKDNFTRLSQYPYVSSGVQLFTSIETTHANIVHGLDYTPDASQFEFEFVGTQGSVTSVSASNIGGTDFDITLTPAPATSVTVYWRIKNNYTNY